MSSESDQHGPMRVSLFLRTTPFEKGLIIDFKEGQLRLVFLVPDVDVAYRS